MIKAPRQTVLNIYADYPSWPRLFPTISAVRLLGREGPKLVLEVDHVEGKVINVPDGTRFTVRGEIHLKGWARLLQPFLRGYTRRHMQRLQLQPVKAEAEARARAGRRSGHAQPGGAVA